MSTPPMKTKESLEKKFDENFDLRMGIKDDFGITYYSDCNDEVNYFIFNDVVKAVCKSLLADHDHPVNDYIKVNAKEQWGVDL